MNAPAAPGEPRRVFRVRIVGSDQELSCPSDVPLLVALARAGRSPIKVGCQRGGCGVCKVRVVRGAYTASKMSAAHVDAAEAREGWALACRLLCESDLVVECGPLPAQVGRPPSK